MAVSRVPTGQGDSLGWDMAEPQGDTTASFPAAALLPSQPGLCSQPCPSAGPTMRALLLRHRPCSSSLAGSLCAAAGECLGKASPQMGRVGKETPRDGAFATFLCLERSVLH